jgi:hypothetical protein
MRSDTLRPLVRALTLPSVLFATALAGHAAGRGLIPTASVLISLFVATVVAVVPFARAPFRPATALALLIGGQGLLHAAFQQLSGPAVTAQTVMSGGSTSPMTMSSSVTNCHLMVHSGSASHGLAMPPMSGGHFVMVLGHLAAAAAVGVWLAAGERALWMLLALATRPALDAWRMVAAVAGGLHQAVDSCRPLLPGWGRPFAVGGSVWGVGAVTRRGPPACCVA